MGEEAIWGLAALGGAALMYLAGIFFALKGDGVLAAILIVGGAVLTLAGAG